MKVYLLYLIICVFSIIKIGGNVEMIQQEPITLQQIKNKYNLQVRKSYKNFFAATFFTPQHPEQLAIFKNDTLVLSVKKQILGHEWIPDKNALVYLAADTIPLGGSSNPAKEIGVFYTDSLKHKKLMDLSTKDNISGVRYAQFNNKVYVRCYHSNDGPKVFQLDIENKELIPTDYKHMNFSPKGKYYTNLTFGNPPIVLYERASNTIKWQGDSSSDAGKMRFLRFFSWYLDAETTFLYLQNRYGVAKINCEMGEVVEFISKPERGMKPVLKSNGNIQWK